MYPEIYHLLYAAEDHYLQASEIAAFAHHIESLSQRLQIYETLREQEVALWEAIAEQMDASINEPLPQLERAMGHWMAVLRYGAMAMLLNNPTFLNHRLLEWLTDIVQAHQTLALDTQIYGCLITQLQERLSAPEWALLEPLMVLAQETLLGPSPEPTFATV